MQITAPTGKIKLITLALILISLLLLTQSVASHPLAQTGNVDWPQLQHDAQHTGRSTAFVAPKYKLKWAWFDENHVVHDFVSAPNKSVTDGFEPGFKVTNLFSEQIQPIIAEGKVYIGSVNGTFYALDALTGDTRWKLTTGGPILQSGAYANGVVIFGSMDGHIYALNANDGVLKWKYKTGAGVYAAPVIANGLALIGGRDGAFYAIDINSGTLKWSYVTRVQPANTASPFNQAPIVTPAVVSEDGSVVMFGAENMFFYGLVTDTGAEKWPPIKLVGQSFQFGWPVIVGGKVIVRTMSSLEGAEFLMERELDTLPYNPSWAQEKAVISNWLNQNPHQKTMYVFDIATGQEPFQVAMGRVTGENKAAHPAVVDYLGRVLTYWRIRTTSFTIDGGCFGTNYCPDISALDLRTGDRILLTPRANPTFTTELDNGFSLSTGGEYLYAHNPFRGSHAIHLPTGAHTWMVAQVAIQDCANWRAWGASIIFYGNDATTDACNISSTKVPLFPAAPPSGFASMAVATTNGTTLLYSNETRAGFFAAFEHTN